MMDLRMQGVPKKTIQRIQHAALSRFDTYRPKPGTLKLLAGPLKYGPAATKFLVQHAIEEFDVEELDALAAPPPAPRAQPPPAESPPRPNEGARPDSSQAGATPEQQDALEDLRRDLRRELEQRLDEIAERTVKLEGTVDYIAQVAIDTGKRFEKLLANELSKGERPSQSPVAVAQTARKVLAPEGNSRA